MELLSPGMGVGCMEPFRFFPYSLTLEGSGTDLQNGLALS